MSENEQGKTVDVTQMELLAWADGLIGVPVHETAQKLGVHRNTVTRYQQKVRDFVDARFDINEYRVPLYGLYGKWLRSVVNNLNKSDVQMTIAIGKGLQLLVDKQQFEDKSRPSPEELADIIADALGNEPEGIRPVDEGGVGLEGDTEEREVTGLDASETADI